jgi:phosphohistidine phosphatase
MKRLYLLRHTKSSWDDSALADIERPLSKRGRQAGAAMGRYLAEAGLLPQRVLCSTARRARETWSQLSADWTDPPPVRYEAALYMAEPDELFEALKALPDGADHVMLIGHNPGMAAFAELLTSATRSAPLAKLRRKYPTGGLAVFDLAIDGWPAIAPHCGRLLRFVTPRDLG